MELKVMTCPECGAQLDIEDGINIFYCKYCGNKIILEGQSSDEIEARVKLKKMEHDEHILELEQQHSIQKIREKDKKEFKHNLVPFLFLGMIMIFVYGNHYLGKLADIKQENALQNTLEIILQDIADENYAEAYIKAETLFWDASHSTGGKEKWDATRKEIIKQIEKAEKESKKSKITDNSEVYSEESDNDGVHNNQWWNPMNWFK